MLRPARIAVFTVSTIAVGSLLAACGSGGGTGSSAGGSAAGAKVTAANCTGGTLYVLNKSKSSSGYDPAVLYTSGGGAIPRLLFRTLTTRQSQPGDAGTKIVPDLATDTGEPSQNATVWTYHLKPGLKYADGTAITSADIKYAVERSFSSQLAGGPPYLRDWLVGGESYQGPYGAGSPELSSITTPDATTIVFHLRKSEGDFPYLASQTQFAPVPKAKDTGKEYNAAPVSSGPYTISSFTKGKELDLVRNTYWDRSTDAQRLACPDNIKISLGLSATVINQRLSASVGNDADAITTDTILDAATLAKVAGNPSVKKRVATGYFADTTYLAFNTKKKPFDNQLVREAFSYAVDRTAVVNAEGGSSLAAATTTFLPASLKAAHQDYDWFPAGRTGNPDKAKQLLAQAGYPNGITVSLAYDNADPAAATALQQAYAKAGITIKLNPIDDSAFSSVVNTPATQPELALTSWGADWPSGAPFLSPIYDGRQIVTGGGNWNLAQYNDAGVNAQIDAINKITDYATAQQKWGELDAQIGKLALNVPLYSEIDSALYGSKVKNTYVDQWRGWYDIASVSVK